MTYFDSTQWIENISNCNPDTSYLTPEGNVQATLSGSEPATSTTEMGAMIAARRFEELDSDVEEETVRKANLHLKKLIIGLPKEKQTSIITQVDAAVSRLIFTKGIQQSQYYCSSEDLEDKMAHNGIAICFDEEENIYKAHIDSRSLDRVEEYPIIVEESGYQMTLGKTSKNTQSIDEFEEFLEEHERIIQEDKFLGICPIGSQDKVAEVMEEMLLATVVHFDSGDEGKIYMQAPFCELITAEIFVNDSDEYVLSIPERGEMICQDPLEVRNACIIALNERRACPTSETAKDYAEKVWERVKDPQLQTERIPLTEEGITQRIERIEKNIETMLEEYNQRLTALGKEPVAVDHVRLPPTELNRYSSSMKKKGVLIEVFSTSLDRYVDIHPFAHTIPSTGDGHYINASHLFLPQGVHFIASQGPKKETLVDHFNMILNERASCLVRLTRHVEKGDEKCAYYWGSDTPPLDLKKGVSVQLLEGKSFSFTDNVTGEVLHECAYLGYDDWPDYGIPGTSNFEELLEKAEVFVTPNSGPILVHCSAGVGRTGAFMASLALRREVRRLLEEGGENPLMNVTEHLMLMRSQRDGLIQTAQQELLVYKVIRDEFRAWKQNQGKKRKLN